LKLLLDINVILDIVLRRKPWSIEGAQLLTAVEAGQAEGYIAAHTLTTIYYYVAKNVGRRPAVTVVTDLLRTVQVVPVGGADFLQALVLGLDDFEDAVQTVAALQIGADYLITRNARDFNEEVVEIRTAAEVLGLLTLAPN
jgi:predicted nucleic acid-binding protein